MDLGKKLSAIRQRLTTRPAGTPPETKVLGDASGVTFLGNTGAARVYFLQSGSDPDAEELTRALALATSAYCYTATEYRWRTISEPPLEIVQDAGDGEEILPDHALTDILADPSPDFDMGELLAITEAYRLTTGAALWVVGRDEGQRAPLTLTPFSADEFRTESAGGRIYGRFLVDTSHGRLTLTPEDVVHFRDTNPNSWRNRLSKLEVALGTLDLGHQVNRTVRQFMRQSMFPGGVISPDPAWNPDEDEFQQYVERIEAWHAGPANAGKPLVTLGGTVFSETALRFKDLLPVELLDRIEATVASVYGIPPVVLGWLVGLKNAPWSHMPEARRMTYEDTIEPRWRDIEKRLDRQLLPIADRAAGRRIRFDLSNVRALKHDEAARAATAAQNREIWTLDERRVYTGMDPIGDERGDQLGGTSAAAAQDGSEGAAPTAPVLAVPKFMDDPKALYWLLFDENCKAAEPTWTREIAKGLEAQKRAILRLADDYLDEKTIDPQSADRLVGKIYQYLENGGLPHLVKLAYPLVLTTAQAGVKKAARQLGLAFDIFESAILGYAERETAFLAGVMTETTGTAVAAAVQKGLAEGDLIRDLTKRLESLPAFDRTRAKMTARTETTRAWNGAQRTSLSEYQSNTGRQVFKLWLSARDARVRDEHADIDSPGQVPIPIDATFPNGLTEPGEPNCRCTLIYSIADPIAPGG